MARYSIVLTETGVDTPLVSGSFEKLPASLLGLISKAVSGLKGPGRAARPVEVVGIVPEKARQYHEGAGFALPENGNWAMPTAIGQVFASGALASRHLGLKHNEVSCLLSSCVGSSRAVGDCEAHRLGVPFKAIRGVAFAFKDTLDAARAKGKASA